MGLVKVSKTLSNLETFLHGFRKSPTTDLTSLSVSLSRCRVGQVFCILVKIQIPAHAGHPRAVQLHISLVGSMCADLTVICVTGL
mmetsp:Transcript_47783/g.86073  ORF Transcript_47783/g.86073 Transcript_47783/m.86073 type:complete len:85 (+) Transcript_47783:535-789(+)